MYSRWSPKKPNREVRVLLDYLGLEESKITLQKYRRPADFDPEVRNCFLNVWVQCLHVGGRPQHGWIIGQDRENSFVEAQFHAVWVSPTGYLIDVTPRTDFEKRIMFVSDENREIALTIHDSEPAIRSFDNVRFWNGRLSTPLTPIVVVPQTKIIEDYGLRDFFSRR